MSLEEDAAAAWLYFYPLVLTHMTLRNEPGLAVNTFKHGETLHGADFKGVIRPNVDTLYAHAWLDVSGGAVAIEIPAMDDLYHVVQAIDEWSITFATLGSRSAGQSGGQFAFVLEWRMPPVEEAGG